jgi:predicted transcriptional regulator
MNETQQQSRRLARLTARVARAYVGGHTLAASAVPDLVAGIHATLAQVALTPAGRSAAPAPLPAVPVNQSVFDGYLICLEDGRKYRTLKRHLRSAYGMSPEDYRAKWGLPGNYPMVAPSYAASRSAVAKAIGLGRSGRRSGLVLWEVGAEIRAA